MVADSQRPELRKLAENIQETQSEQIQQMRAWSEERYPAELGELARPNRDEQSAETELTRIPRRRRGGGQQLEEGRAPLCSPVSREARFARLYRRM